MFVLYLNLYEGNQGFTSAVSIQHAIRSYPLTTVPAQVVRITYEDTPETSLISNLQTDQHFLSTGQEIIIMNSQT
jgi:hypothetical protein